MKAIFGLGNPGKKYKDNRHNIGYRVVDGLVRHESLTFKKSFKLPASIAKKKVGKEEIFFIKPHTFMNNCGLCAKKVLHKYKLENTDFLVIYDDIDLPLGKIRFRKTGSSGGHRGMESMITALGTSEIPRLRVGIGRRLGIETAEYVLSDFSKDEEKILKETMERVVLACQDWVKLGE